MATTALDAKEFYRLVFTSPHPHGRGRRGFPHRVDQGAYDKSASQIVGWMTEFFRDPIAVMSGFSRDQQSKGMLVIAWRCMGFVWYGSVPLEMRTECVEAMYDLFDKCFRFEPYEDAGLCFDWWGECFYFHMNADNRGQTQRKLRELEPIAIKTMRRIFAIETIPCRMSALCGLGNAFNRRSAVASINGLIRKYPGMPAEVRKYAEDAKTFVM